MLKPNITEHGANTFPPYLHWEEVHRLVVHTPDVGSSLTPELRSEVFYVGAPLMMSGLRNGFLCFQVWIKYITSP